MASRPLELNSFFIFNRNLGSSEEDATLAERADKLLYFFPPAMEQHSKVNLVETLEAFVDLSQLIDLGDSDPIHSICLTDVRYALLEFAPRAFICVGLNTNNNNNGSGSSSNETSAIMETSSNSITSLLYNSFVGGTSSNQASFDSKLLPSPEAMRALLKETADLLCLLLGWKTFAQLSKETTGKDVLTKLRAFLARQVPFLLENVTFDLLSCASTNVFGRNVMEYHVPKKEVLFACQSLFESLCAAEQHNPIFINRKLVLMRDMALMYSTIPPADVTLLMTLLRHLDSMELNSGDSGFFMLAQALNLEPLCSPGKYKSYHGSRGLAPSIYLKNCRQRFAMLRGKGNMKMIIFLKENTRGGFQEDDEVFEKLVFETLEGIQRAYQNELNRIGRMIPTVAPRDDLKSSRMNHVYINETSRLVLASEPFISRLAKCERSSFLCKAHLPPDVIRGMDLCRELLARHLDSTTAVTTTGTWTVAAMRSGARILFIFSNPLRESYLALPLDLRLLKEVIHERFNSFLMV